MCATFAQWTKEQENRQDSVGYFARFWNEITPGKISSIGGVERTLRNIESSAESGGTDKDQTAVKAAISGFGLAVKEYEENAARQAATDSDGRISPRPPDESEAEPAPGSMADNHAAWKEARKPKPGVTGAQVLAQIGRTPPPPPPKPRPRTALEKLADDQERMMGLIAELIRQNGELIALLRPPAPLPWADWHRMTQQPE